MSSVEKTLEAACNVSLASESMCKQTISDATLKTEMCWLVDICKRSTQPSKCHSTVRVTLSLHVFVVVIKITFFLNTFFRIT